MSSDTWVRDDGKGIDQAILAAQGVEGHYGLRGMPERAALIGGKLAVWSEVGAGTEVELRIPASAVYATCAERSWWSRLSASSMPAEERRCVVTDGSSPIRILAVDDHPLVRNGIAGLVAIQTDMTWWRKPPTAATRSSNSDAPSGRHADGPADAGNERP